MREICLPDLGGVQEVEVIEVSVSPGAKVHEGDILISIESDKATMEIPSPCDGIVAAVLVAVGDKLAADAPIVSVEAGAAQGEKPVDPPSPAPVEERSSSSSPNDGDNAAFDVVVIGGGPGGYSAAFRAADLGLKVALVERHENLGGVCLNVGCIPSKTLLHVADQLEAAKALAEFGATVDGISLDIDKVRGHKDRVVGKLRGGLAAMAKARKVSVIIGEAQFASADTLTVNQADSQQTIAFKRAIIGVGSRPVHLPFLPEDSRIVDSTGALELRQIPERMLVIGGGIIGLEMGSVYASLGSAVDVVEMAPDLIPGADKDLVAVWKKVNKGNFSALMPETTVERVEAHENGILAHFSGKHAPSAPKEYDLVLQSVGRIPNGDGVGLEHAGLSHDRGFISVDPQRRTAVATIFAIGDVVGGPMLAHKAVHEGHVAAEVIAGELLKNEALSRVAFDAAVIPSVAYTHPEIAWVGETENSLKEQNRPFKKAVFPWAASGRAIANGCEYGLTKLLIEPGSGVILGGAIVGDSAGDMIGEVALAIEMAADTIDLGKTVHAHPTLGETIGLAAEVAKGSCTDLLP